MYKNKVVLLGKWKIEFCLICLFLCLLPLSELVVAIYPTLDNKIIGIGYIRFFLALTLCILNIRHFNRWYICGIVLLWIGYLYSLFIDFGNYNILKTMLLSGNYLCIAFFSVYMASGKSISTIYNSILYTSYVIVIISVLRIACLHFTGFNYMAFGYEVILYWLIVTQNVFHRPTVPKIGFSIITGIIIALFSNRMVPVIQILMSICFIFLYGGKKFRLGMIGCGLSLALFLYLTVNSWLNKIIGKIETLGNLSRNVRAILDTDKWIVVSNQTRISFWRQAWGYINEHWLLGNGVGFDKQLFGSYVHNLEIELLLDFGLIVGGFLILLIIFVLIYVFFMPESVWKYLLVPILFCGFLHLQVSSSIYEVIEIKMGVALLLNYFRQNLSLRRRYYARSILVR